MKHPKRNEISKALGFDPNIGLISDYIETGISPFLPGDIILLCSDGLTDMVNSKTITSILTSRQKISQKAKSLVDAANDAGGRDNITVVLVQNNNKPVVHEATKPSIIKKNELQTENGEFHNSEDARARPAKNNRTLVVVLVILSLGLLAALLWQLSKNKKPVAASSTIPVAKSRNSNEQKLVDSIGQTSRVLLNDSVFGKSITISEPVFISNDSLYINGHGIILRSDTSYKSVGFVIGNDSKFILLEDLVFENFESAIIAQTKTVHLKNVRFLNCDVSIQYQYRFPQNKYVNGYITDTLVLSTDSLAK
jgi:PPM family protein phosphatase